MEAEIVKRIFREYLEGASCKKIARGLERDGIRTAWGNARWHDSTVRKILENEKYMGDALLQKTYTIDFLNKKRGKNNGTLPQYYIEDDHEAIIPKDLFLRVQEEMARRSSERDMNGRRRGFSANHAFSHMVICECCGEHFRRLHWNNRGKKTIVWRCKNRLEEKIRCTARTVSEEALSIALSTISKFLLSHDMKVILVIFDWKAFELSGKLVGDIEEYIDEHSVSQIRDAEYYDGYENIEYIA